MKLNSSSPVANSTKQSEPPISLHNMVELHVPDFELTRNFYTGLGFEVIWERNPEGFKGYLVLKLEGNILCFWGGNENIYQHEHFSQFDRKTQRGYGVEIVHLISNLETLYFRAQSLDCVVEDLKLKPWGIQDFRIIDPWGYYIRFSAFHNILSSGNAVD